MSEEYFGNESSPFNSKLPAIFVFQLVVLGLLSRVKDKSRLPMSTLNIIALGYIPMFAVIKRGTFARSDSGYNSLYIFYLVSLTVALIGVFGKWWKNIKDENLPFVGLLMAFAFVSLLAATLDAGIQKFILVIMLGPLALTTEKIAYNKERSLSLAALVLLVSQMGLYHLILSSRDAMRSAMYYFAYGRAPHSMPGEIYGFLVVVALIVSLLPPRVKRRNKSMKDEGKGSELVSQKNFEDEKLTGGEKIPTPLLSNPFETPEESKARAENTRASVMIVEPVHPTLVVYQPADRPEHQPLAQAEANGDATFDSEGSLYDPF